MRASRRGSTSTRRRAAIDATDSAATFPARAAAAPPLRAATGARGAPAAASVRGHHLRAPPRRVASPREPPALGEPLPEEACPEDRGVATWQTTRSTAATSRVSWCVVRQAARRRLHARHHRRAATGPGMARPARRRGERGSDSPDRQAVNVALTSAGLRALGLPPQIGAQFSREFIDGMTEEHRRRILGDVDDSAPERWGWGGPDDHEIHVLLMVFARHEQALADALRRHEEAMPEAGIRLLRTLDTRRSRTASTSASSTASRSRPWRASAGPMRCTRSRTARSSSATATSTAASPRARSCRGRRSRGRPSVGRRGLGPPRPRSQRELPRHAAALPGRLRLWDFCERATARPDGSVDERARLRLAAKLLGRWPSGAPLVLAPDDDRPDLRAANDFKYFHADRAGLRCPLGAHIRRANPRDTLDPSPGNGSLHRGEQAAPPAPPRPQVRDAADRTTC